jgi:hypothetical protein
MGLGARSIGERDAGRAVLSRHNHVSARSASRLTGEIRAIRVPLTSAIRAIRVPLTGGSALIRVPLTGGSALIRVPLTGGSALIRVPSSRHTRLSAAASLAVHVPLRVPGKRTPLIPCRCRVD